MSWKETSPGVHQRALGGGERGMVAAISGNKVSTREILKLHCFAEIRTQNKKEESIPAFREAWKALRLLKSPDVAATFHDGMCEYRAPEKKDLEEWLQRTFLVADQDKPVEEVVREMQGRQEFLPVCYMIPKSAPDAVFKCTIVLFISHWRADDSGCLMIIGQLCDYAHDIMNGAATKEALKAHKLGTEAQLLVPAMEDILMPDKVSSPESKSRIQAIFQAYYMHLPSLDLTMKAKPNTPFSNTMLIRNTYSSVETVGWRAFCKIKGVSVTAAVHAAYIRAVRNIAEESKQQRPYTVMMPAQVRHRLGFDSPYRSQGCWQATQSLMLVVPAGVDFIPRAQTLSQQYGFAEHDMWWTEDCREMQAQLEAMPSKMPKELISAALPSFTGLGVLDAEILPSWHGSITIEDIWVWPDQLGPGAILTCWTFKERLSIQMTWNATFHSEQQIQDILDAIDKTFAVEINIERGTHDTVKTKY